MGRRAARVTFYPMSPRKTLLDELGWRGMVFQQTEGLGRALDSGSISAYCGFDPTAPSLHVGNLVPVMGLVHLQRGGHRPIVLVGGGTGLIGDPSGKTAERQLSGPEVVEENTARLHQQLERFLDFGGQHAARMRNNAAWLLKLAAVEFMRDVGKHFTVSYMVQKESVRSRLESGISYTEFSYMLLQAYDFLELHRREGVTVQVGGSDQWGNITAGIELVRRVTGAEVHGFTFPLITDAAGTKFGKTEAGPVWLDAARTSPYRFYQFWIQTPDADTGRYLRLFTLLPRESIVELDAALARAPESREAQRELAREVTVRVHGVESAKTAEEVSTLLFGQGDAESLSASALEALSGEVPFLEVGSGDGGAVDVIELLPAVGLAPSRGAAKRLVEQGGVYANGRRITAAERSIAADAFLPGRHVLLRKGSRDYALVRVR